MRFSPVTVPFATLVLAAGAVAGTTVYNGSVSQVSPPGAVASEQVLIINNDANGNQQVLSIGHPGTTAVIRGPQPCNRERPTVAMDCTGEDLRGVRWTGARLTAGRFDGADLRGALLQSTLLDNVSFNKARLDRANLGAAELVNGSFSGTSLASARLEGATLVNTDFVDADLSNANLRGATLINTGFAGSNLARADLTGSELVNADFDTTRLDQATWVDGRRCGTKSASRCAR